MRGSPHSAKKIMKTGWKRLAAAVRHLHTAAGVTVGGGGERHEHMVDVDVGRGPCRGGSKSPNQTKWSLSRSICTQVRMLATSRQAPVQKNIEEKTTISSWRPRPNITLASAAPLSTLEPFAVGQHYKHKSLLSSTIHLSVAIRKRASFHVHKTNLKNLEASSHAHPSDLFFLSLPSLSSKPRSSLSAPCWSPSLQRLQRQQHTEVLSNARGMSSSHIITHMSHVMRSHQPCVRNVCASLCR